MIDKNNYNLLEHNTFGINEECRRYVSFNTEEELMQLLHALQPSDLPLLILGGGSNILLTKRFEGTVLHSAIRGIEVIDEGESVLLRCGSGECWDEVVDYAVSHGYFGAENLSLIPGDVGASAVQNIGAYGREVKDILETVEAIDISTFEKRVFHASECDYGYRHSKFKAEWKNRFVITFVTYRLQKTFTPFLEYGNIRSELEKRGIACPNASELREVIIDIRNAKLPDPKNVGNAGSFFMNPVVKIETFKALQKEYPSMPHYTVSEQFEKIPAGWLIDQCGWKGRALGRAAVHDRQALVLINKGGATGEEILSLSDAVRKDVKEKFGIDISPEVNIV